LPGTKTAKNLPESGWIILRININSDPPPLTPIKIYSFDSPKIGGRGAKGRTGSKQFQDTLAAEDMEGGDLEYIEWMGEYQFFLELEEKIQSLKSLEYVNE
jgi:hypothetical protein